MITTQVAVLTPLDTTVHDPGCHSGARHSPCRRGCCLACWEGGVLPSRSDDGVAARHPLLSPPLPLLPDAPANMHSPCLPWLTPAYNPTALPAISLAPATTTTCTATTAPRTGRHTHPHTLNHTSHTLNPTCDTPHSRQLRAPLHQGARLKRGKDTPGARIGAQQTPTAAAAMPASLSSVNLQPVLQPWSTEPAESQGRRSPPEGCCPQ
jgi:hypothetical protein